MSGKYATPLRLEPGSSRTLCTWLVLVHVAAVMVLPFVSLPVWAGLIALFFIVFSLWRAVRLHITQAHPDSLCAVQWYEQRVCKLSLSSGQAVKANLMPRFFMLHWLVIMHFRSERGQAHYLVLLPDMLEPEVFRRLRVRLMIELNQAVS